MEIDISELCRRQAHWCERLGSPLYAGLLRHVAEDYDAHGPARGLLAPHADDPPASALALRLMGAVHRLVLAGDARELARFYPSVSRCGQESERGTADAYAAWEAFRALLADSAAALAPLLHNPVQTNDVGRSGTLLGGFLDSAARFGKPLRLLEVGASAGLNLLWDRYRYEWGDGAGWGSVEARVRMREVFQNEPPVWPAQVEIVERRGCDPRPVDPASAAGQLTLLSYTWADQTERIERLLAACAVAREQAAVIDAARAGDWLARQLAREARGVLTVIFHSVVWQYLSAEEKRQVERVIAEAGARATDEAPLVWLRMEPQESAGIGPPELRRRGFPGGEERVLATSSYHAPSVLWL
jgi:hypothetical protein